MDLRWRLRRCLGERGLFGTIFHIPEAAAKHLLIAVRQRRSMACAPALAAAANPALLQLGSGPDRHPGWLNVDLNFPAELCLDLTRPLPLPEGSIDAVYSQHFIEHVTREHGAALVRECARVLRPGAWLRISTPDLAYFVQQWQIQAQEPQSYDRAATDELNDIIRLHEHQYVYDYGALRELFVQAGLVDIQRARPQESASPHLRNLEGRLVDVPEDEAARDLIVEGRKPEG